MTDHENQRQETERTLLDLLRAQARGPITIEATTDFVADLGLESIQVMSFVMEVEEHFDVAIDLDTLSGVRTLRDLAGAVEAARERQRG
ncbi:MAG: acyl carrier protein [Steroidobacteraceae bacterium]